MFFPSEKAPIVSPISLLPLCPLGESQLRCSAAFSGENPCWRRLPTLCSPRRPGMKLPAFAAVLYQSHFTVNITLLPPGDLRAIPTVSPKHRRNIRLKESVVKLCLRVQNGAGVRSFGSTSKSSHRRRRYRTVIAAAMFRGLFGPKATPPGAQAASLATYRRRRRGVSAWHMRR